MELFKISNSYYLEKYSAAKCDDDFNTIYYYDILRLIKGNTSDPNNISTMIVIFTTDDSIEEIISILNDNYIFYNEKVNYIQEQILINEKAPFMSIYHFVNCCKINLNFKEKSFNKDLAEYLIKILQNLVFI